MFAFYQSLTVVNGIIFNYFYPARKVLIQNVAIFKWADLDVLKIQVSLKKVFMLLYSVLNYNETQNYHY